MNPGGNLAIKKGCMCPILDNTNGRGTGDGYFRISADCPIHGENKRVKH